MSPNITIVPQPTASEQVRQRTHLRLVPLSPQPEQQPQSQSERSGSMSKAELATMWFTAHHALQAATKLIKEEAIDNRSIKLRPEWVELCQACRTYKRLFNQLGAGERVMAFDSSPITDGPEAA